MPYFAPEIWLQPPILLAIITIALPIASLAFPKRQYQFGKVVIATQILCFLAQIARPGINYAGPTSYYYFLYHDQIMSDLWTYLVLVVGAYTSMGIIKQFYIVERIVAGISIFIFSTIALSLISRDPFSFIWRN